MVTRWKNFAPQMVTLSKINDAAVDNIVVSSVQRVRNYAHINSLRQAKLELMRIVATRDSRTSDICELLDGKLIRVGVAAAAIDALVELEPDKFAERMYHSAAAREYASDPAAYVKDRISDGVIDDDLVSGAAGFRPITRAVAPELRESFQEASNEKVTFRNRQS